MRRVSTDNLRTGDRIARDVYTTPDSAPLLRTGIRVSDSYRQALQRAGVTSVWVDDELSQGIEPLEVLAEQTKRRATVAIRGAFQDVSQSFATGGALTADTVQDMAEVADLIASDIAGSVESALALNDLANADGYTMKHSLAVTALGLALALRVMRRHGWVDHQGRRRHDRVDERLSVLGVGLLLHDIGKLAVPPAILHKPGPLTDEEWVAMRAHPVLGYRILQRAEAISPLARTVVRSHHERWDGSGYPDRKSGGEIHLFARIATVADVFDALTSDRPYRRADPAHRGYEFILARAGRDFDPDVVDVFRSSVAPHPPGTGVVLSDGSCAVVKAVRPEQVALPVVRIVLDRTRMPIVPRDVDLSCMPGLTIVSSDFDPWTVPVNEAAASR